MAAKNTRNSVKVVKAAFLQNRNLSNILPCSPRQDSTLLNQLSEYANSILKIEVEKSGLEDKIKIGSLSTIQLETERHIVEIFGSRSSVGVDLQYMRGPKGGTTYFHVSFASQDLSTSSPPSSYKSPPSCLCSTSSRPTSLPLSS